MTVAEKEGRISDLPFPLRELMELAQHTRDSLLKDMDEPETERSGIERDYEAALDRILVSAGL